METTCKRLLAFAAVAAAAALASAAAQVNTTGTETHGAGHACVSRAGDRRIDTADPTAVRGGAVVRFGRGWVYD